MDNRILDWNNLVILMNNCKKNELKKAALIQVESFLERIENKIGIDNHDMGFLYSPSCVASYKIAKNQKGYKAALLAAENLASRFQKKGGFIQAWGSLNEDNNYRLIIDCLLNVPLLFWAYDMTGKSYFKEYALSHIETAMSVVIRDDFQHFIHSFLIEKQALL